MQLNPHHLIRGLILLVLFATQYLAQSGQGEPVLRSITERLFTAYAEKDDAKWSALWSSGSPYKDVATEEVRWIFSRVDRPAARIKQIDNATFDGGRASVDVEVEFDSVSKRAQVLSIGYSTGRWTLQFILENGDWKIWRRISAERQLAERLIALVSADERNRLVRAEPKVSMSLVVRAIGDESVERRPRISVSEEDRLHEIAISVA